ncbi:MAG: sigma-70 family RNA polymerase sigma factor [Prolixibacteraceae bacterium]|jgi:RNA polymerase sigma factor (sigma-70 family)|nr:sigma-70 family RNA polymerase sigma factor [Prolixibacteraceae bacterium]
MKKQDNNDYHAIWESFITNGNHEAIGMIYFGHYDLLYNFGLKYTKDVQVIEDAIQNTFGYFLKTGRKLSPVTNLRSFLLQSFRHRLLLELKRRSRIFHMHAIEAKNVGSHEPEVNEKIEQEWSSWLGKKISKCMERLTGKQKEILYLRFQCDLSYAEIASMLDITVDSCYKMTYRSLKELREDIEELESIGHRLIMFFMIKS